jgi:hypothetical protein
VSVGNFPDFGLNWGMKGTDPGRQKRPQEIETRLKLQSTLRRRFAFGLGMIIFSIVFGLGGWAVFIGVAMVLITAVLTTFAGEWTAIFWIAKTPL